MINTELGARLRKAREEKRLTQQQVAEMLGVHNSTLGKYELGKREPDFKTILRLADIYEVSPIWIITGQNEINRAESRNDAQTTIKLIEEEAHKLGYSLNDPDFQNLLADAFELIRIARRKDSN